MTHATVIRRPWLLLLLLLTAFPVHAQFEITPYIGIKSIGAADLDDQNPLGISRLEFDRDVSYGAGLLYNVHDLVGLEFFWNRQNSEVRGFLADGTSVSQTADATVNQFHGLAHIHTAGLETALRPYLVVGAGATRIGTDGNSSTHLSYTLGLGLKYSLTERFGLRLQGRWTPTYIGVDPEGFACNSLTSGCLLVPDQQVMSQGDYTAGVVYRF